MHDTHFGNFCQRKCECEIDFVAKIKKKNNFKFALAFKNITKHVNSQTNC